MIEVCLFPFIIYLGVGIYYTDEAIIELIAISISFCFGFYLFYYIYYFYQYGIKEKAKVIKKSKAPFSGDDMTMTFYFQFLVKDKIYQPPYSYNVGPKINTLVDVIIIEKEHKILPIDRLYWFIFYCFTSLFGSLAFYYIKIMNINL